MQIPLAIAPEIERLGIYSLHAKMLTNSCMDIVDLDKLDSGPKCMWQVACRLQNSELDWHGLHQLQAKPPVSW
jgi:hypothetical protein